MLDGERCQNHVAVLKARQMRANLRRRRLFRFIKYNVEAGDLPARRRNGELRFDVEPLATKVHPLADAVSLASSEINCYRHGGMVSRRVSDGGGRARQIPCWLDRQRI